MVTIESNAPLYALLAQFPGDDFHSGRNAEPELRRFFEIAESAGRADDAFGGDAPVVEAVAPEEMPFHQGDPRSESRGPGRRDQARRPRPKRSGFAGLWLFLLGVLVGAGILYLACDTSPGKSPCTESYLSR